MPRLLPRSPNMSVASTSECPRREDFLPGLRVAWFDRRGLASGLWRVRGRIAAASIVPRPEMRSYPRWAVEARHEWVLPWLEKVKLLSLVHASTMPGVVAWGRHPVERRVDRAERMASLLERPGPRSRQTSVSEGWCHKLWTSPGGSADSCRYCRRPPRRWRRTRPWRCRGCRGGWPTDARHPALIGPAGRRRLSGRRPLSARPGPACSGWRRPAGQAGCRPTAVNQRVAGRHDTSGVVK